MFGTYEPSIANDLYTSHRKISLAMQNVLINYIYKETEIWTYFRLIKRDRYKDDVIERKNDEPTNFIYISLLVSIKLIYMTRLSLHFLEIEFWSSA